MLYVNPLASHVNAPGENISGNPARQKMALQEYEHYFLYTMLEEMQKSVPKGGILDSGPEMGYYQDMLNDTLSGEMAKSGQMGIAKMIGNQIRIAEMQKSLLDSLNTPKVDGTGVK